MTPTELRLLLSLGLVRPVKGSADGSVVVYELTGDARILLANNLQKDCPSVLTDTLSEAKVVP